MAHGAQQAEHPSVDAAPTTRAQLRAEAGGARRPRPRRARARALTVIRDGLLAVLGTVGALVAVWTLLTLLLPLQMTVLLTGSMSPGMPPGTAVIEHTVPADELGIGDVVTVPRSHDGAPVTHRIIAIDAADDPAQRLLRLQGDANATADDETYTVAETPRMLFAIPGIGYALMWAQRPIVLLLLAGAVALLVTWTFWPTKEEQR